MQEFLLKDIASISNRHIDMTNTNIQEKTDIHPLFIKVEKIVSALYMVVSYIDQRDPIVPELKRAGLALLESLYETKKEYQTSHRVSFDAAQQALTSLIRIAKVSEIMSPMNADILLRNIATLSQEKRDDATKAFVLSQDFFESPTQPVALEKTIQPVTISSAPLPQYVAPVVEKKESNKSPVVTSSDLQKRDHQPVSSKEISTGKKLDLALKLSRRNTLLKLTKDKGSINIKECMSVIHDCSEKTIQRELTALVDQKILKKTGDKRWSRYSLA